VTSHKYYNLVYPEATRVSDDTIERWFCEARAANEIGLDYIHARTPDEMAEALEDMGFIRRDRGAERRHAIREEYPR
jgi:hypothetical protein